MISDRGYLLKGMNQFQQKNISYYSDTTKLFPTLKEAIKEAEWDDLKIFKLRVFLRFF